MIEVDYELGKKIVETCECECGGVLTLPWGGSWGINSFVLQCAKNLGHNQVVPIKSLTQMWRDGEELPCFIADKIEKKYRRETMEQETVKALVVKKDAGKLGTYLQAKFPGDLAKPEAALDFARWCIAHQLEPVLDVVPYHGSPYIRVNWLDKQAAADPKYKGVGYRVMGKEEKEALDFQPRDLVCEALGYWEGLDKPVPGLGVITLEEREETTEKGSRRHPVVAAKPQLMMFKRARSTVLAQRYHPPAPILEELPYTTATVIEADYRVLEEEGSPTLSGGDETAETTPPRPEPSPSPAQMNLGEGEVDDAVSVSPKPEKSKKNPTASAVEAITDKDVPDLPTLYKHCDIFWGLTPLVVANELGYTWASDLADASPDPWQTWLQIKANMRDRGK